jgi:hypothetical protein
MLFFLILLLSGGFAKKWRRITFCLIVDLMKKIGALKSELNIPTSTATFMK